MKKQYGKELSKQLVIKNIVVLLILMVIPLSVSAVLSGTRTRSDANEVASLTGAIDPYKQTSCKNNALYMCNKSLTDCIYYQHCSHGCVNGASACSPTCFPGEYKCSFDLSYQCNSLGTEWVFVKACQYGCNLFGCYPANTCDSTKTPYRCYNSSHRQKCGGLYQGWQTPTLCENGCDSATSTCKAVSDCAGLVLPASRCADSTHTKVCTSLSKGWGSPTLCLKGCVASTGKCRK